MIIFSTFLKVIKKNLFTIILYTAILLIVSVINLQSTDPVTDFSAEKPGICLVNHDPDSALSKGLEAFLQKQTDLQTSEEAGSAEEDALFYRKIAAIVIIPEHYGADVMAGKSSDIILKTSGTASSSFVKMMLDRYVRAQQAYVSTGLEEEKVVSSVERSLESRINVRITSQKDAAASSQISFYFNFASYSMMACIVFIVCLVMSSFNNTNIRKRSIVASMSNRRYTTSLLLACSTYSFVVWIFFSAVSYCLIGAPMLSASGALSIVNALVFSFTTLSLSYMLSTLIREKEAVTVIANVLSLGSAFLCGAFVPSSMLPDGVLIGAHALPSYWYIHFNERLRDLEEVNLETVLPLMNDMVVLFLFGLVFIGLSVVISAKKRQMQSFE